MTVFWAPRWEGVLRAGRDDRISGDEIMKLVLLGAPGSGKGTQGEKIAAKYKQHSIDEKPYLFLKSDSGTYGMGVMAVENPEDIIHLNRKNRNNLLSDKIS